MCACQRIDLNRCVCLFVCVRALFKQIKMPTKTKQIIYIYTDIVRDSKKIF